MTLVAPPPQSDDIPGVTRRHRPADLYHERTNFQFIKHSKRWLIISSTLVVLSLVLLGVRGLNLGIDFEGGTAWSVQMKGGTSAKVADVRTVLDKLGFGEAKVSVLTPPGGGTDTIRVEARVIDDPIVIVQKALAKYGQINDAEVTVPAGSGAGGSFTFTAKNGVKPTVAGVTTALAGTGLTKPKITVTGNAVTVAVTQLPPSQVQSVAAGLAKYAGAAVADVSITTVGPTWGHEVSQKALKALVIFFFVLAAYLALRFEWKMSAAAIVAVIHDIIFTVGVYALFHFQVSPATVTAFLTILGFSLYDTVVVFDKVVEFQRTLTATGRSTYSEMVNRSLNAVLMRSVSTSLVALLPVVSLLVVGAGVLGATALEDFALALAAGLFIGSYSSIFVAAPLLAWWKEREPQYRALAERRRRSPGAAAAAVASVGVPVVTADEPPDGTERKPLGIPGPPAVPRTTIQPRPRQQRGRKRK